MKKLLKRSIMRESCFIDSSVFYHVIIKNRTDLLRKLSKFVLFTSTNVLEEVSYKIIIDSVLEEIKLQKASFYKIKELFEREVAKELIEKRLHVLNFIASKINVISPNFDDFNLAKRFINKYKLLSNDALILAIALRNGINKLATFDSDFKRVRDLIEILDESYFK